LSEAVGTIRNKMGLHFCHGSGILLREKSLEGFVRQIGIRGLSLAPKGERAFLSNLCQPLDKKTGQWREEQRGNAVT
jgi:hypothetical protein